MGGGAGPQGVETIAKLHSEQLELEIVYKERDGGEWIEYEVWFRWQGQPLVDDALLERDGAYWGGRSPSAFLANDYEEDTLIATMERVLQTNEPDYWEPLEPDLIVAIYPEQWFPFLPSHHELIWRSEESQQAQATHEQRKAEAGGRLPTDPITIICFVDSYNLRGGQVYSSDGLALVLSTTRQERERFAADLRAEYAAFRERFPRPLSQPESDR